MLEILSLENLSNALKFYNIDGKEYQEKIFNCAIKIKENDNLKNKFMEIYDKLYINNDNISNLWQYHETKDLFGYDYYDFMTNILLLSGYKYHIRNIKKLNFDDNQIKLHKQRVKESLINDIYIRKYQSIRISQMLWGVYFINGRIIEVGRLQYEIKNDFIRIHIPRNGKLDYNKVIDSLKKSKKEIKKYFNLINFDYYIDSWLLSKDIINLLKPNSNILKFQSLFEIKAGESCIDDILNFVYNLKECNNYNLLPTNTSLQKSIKEYLLAGNDIKIGKGKLKKELI